MFQPQRLRRFPLPMIDRHDAGAHHFRDEGCRIGNKPDQQREIFRADIQAAAEIEAAQLGVFNLPRGTQAPPDRNG